MTPSRLAPHEHATLLAFLSDYLDVLASRSSNDWDWPATWSPEHREQFWREYHAFNGTPPEDQHANTPPMDFQVLALLRHKLTESAGPVAVRT